MKNIASNDPTVSQSDVKRALKDIRISNMNKLIFGHLNINSLRTNLIFLVNKLKVPKIFLWYQKLNWMIVPPKLNF